MTQQNTPPQDIGPQDISAQDISAQDAPLSEGAFTALDESRVVIRVAGADSESFLQGLLTNDIATATTSRAVYAALLTPQGKFLFDMFILRVSKTEFLLDAQRVSSTMLMQRLNMYKLRADVVIKVDDMLAVALIWGEGTVGVAIPTERETYSAPDPRDLGLGVRVITAAPETVLATATPGDLMTYHAHRIALGAPESGTDLIANETFPLEADFERLQGVDFRKGCYVGQEVTARMKHKAVLKKRLVRLRITEGRATPHTEIRAGDKPAGVLGSVAGDRALAVLRVDRLSAGELTAGDAKLEVAPDTA